MLKETGAPEQPLIVGVTVIVPVIATVPVLVAVKEEIFPVPLAGKPMSVLVFIQV